MPPLQVVVIDDEPDTCAFLEEVLVTQGHTARSFASASTAEECLSSNAADLVLIDVYLGKTNGIELAGRLHVLRPGLYIVVMTARASLETAAQSAVDGALEYVSKPLTIEQIRAICTRAEGFRSQGQRPVVAPEPVPPQSAIIGRSPKMIDVYNAIGRVAPSNASVLILGASGTGKELVARAIHRYSKRAEMPFTPVNCGSFTETILESELFGHEKGAFTGAQSIHRGLFEATNGGTLFLDEVTETTLSFQVKLLRAIQEQQVRRVGSNRFTAVDVRILAASNRDISALIKRELFRDDLYYRLGVVQISLPSLEERREDIPLLVSHFLGEFNSKNERRVVIEPTAVERLQAMKWPGNVRELENTVHRLAIFAPAGRISLADLDAEAARSSQKLPVAEQEEAAPDRLNEMERQQISRVLKESHGNKAEAARRLGIERKTLYKKAVRLGIDLHPAAEE